MTYNQLVMTKAHELYRANGGGSRDLFAACLSIAHSIVKERIARDRHVAAYRATRLRVRFAETRLAA